MHESGVTPGSKIFLMMKKAEEGDSASKGKTAPTTDFWHELNKFLCKHFKPDDAKRVMEQFRVVCSFLLLIYYFHMINYCLLNTCT